MQSGIEYSLIYDFQFQTWRIHSYPSSHFYHWNNNRMLWDSVNNGKSGPWLEDNDIVFNPFSGWTPLLNGQNKIFIERFYDVYHEHLDRTPKLPASYIDVIDTENHRITGTVISHDIGDGQNDYLLDDVMIEAYPLSLEFPLINDVYDKNDPDPILSIATRHQSNSSGFMPQIEALYDLFGSAIKHGWRKWLIRTSPTNRAPGRPNSKVIRTRESFYFRVPFGIRFRKGVIYFQTRSLSMIREIRLKMREYQRRHFS
jgi:hypothetical protein